MCHLPQVPRTVTVRFALEQDCRRDVLKVVYSAVLSIVSVSSSWWQIPFTSLYFNTLEVLGTVFECLACVEVSGLLGHYRTRAVGC
jgi:hypothetical protein